VIGSNSTCHLAFYGAMATAIILLGALFAAQALHDHRLRTFGNPRLLGFAGLWPRRICSAVLLAAAAGALVSLIGGSGIDPSAEDAGLTVYLVDPPGHSHGALNAGATWEDYLGDLQQVVQNVGSERVSIYISGSPPRLVVPATRDLTGAMQLLDAGSPHYEASSAADISASVDAVGLILSRQGAAAVPPLIVVSPRTAQEIDVAAGAVRPATRILFVHSTMGKGTLEYRRGTASAQWATLHSPGFRRSPAENLSRSYRKARPLDAPDLALIAFLSLFLELTLRLYRPIGGRSWVSILRTAGAALSRIGKAGVSANAARILALLIGLASSLEAASVPSQQPGTAHRILQEALNPHLAVITEVSNVEPHVGEQFSVVYKLRCSIPPAAVDVDPQDVTGFWTVTAPTRGEARAEAVTLNGRPATDFLLRQLIAFPLRPGKQVLPPLRLKIKQQGGSREDWDLKASTQSVEVEVSPVPGGGEARKGYLIVGSLEGRVTGAGRDGARAAVLEIEGTANLDFFAPEQWLKYLDAPGVKVRLKDKESLIQTRDYEGKRRLSLLQRQRWTVYAIPWGNAAVQVASFSVPFFDPEASKWRTLDLPSFVLGAGSAASRDAQEAFHHDRDTPGQSRHGPRGTWVHVAIALTVCLLALLVLAIAESRNRAGSRPAALVGQGGRAKVSS
jgi:hypothetical protein